MTAQPRLAPAAGMVLGSCLSLQLGAGLAARLFPVAGSAGASLLRLGIAGAVLLAVARPRMVRWSLGQWRAVLLFGASLAGMNGFFYAALTRVPLGTAVTIEFLGPLTLAAVLSRRPRDIVWVLTAAAGVVALGVVRGGVGLDPVGLAFALISAAFWALYIVAGARAGAAVPGHGGLAVAMSAASLIILPLGLPGAVSLAAQPHLLPLAVATGLLGSVLPYSLELSALRRLPKHVFGVLLSLEPALATLVGWLLLAQPVGPVAAAATGLVVLASVGSTLSAAYDPSRGSAKVVAVNET